MGIRMHPGLKAAGIDPNIVDQLVEASKMPLEAVKKRKEKLEMDKKEFEQLGTLLNDFDASLGGLKTKTDFYKLKLESSHPDIIEGTVAAGALLGSYELEVRSMAKTEKELAYGFPDKDETSVGFGYMLIEREGKEPAEIVVEPNTTLQDLANQINDTNSGVKAMVINTKYQPDPYRLLVVSEESGKEAKISIDEDTTFMEFKEQVTGRNVEVLFEDVPITDEDNILEELISGVSLTVKRSEPGTRVQVSIVHDNDATLEGIKEFVDKYNAILGFAHSQYQENPDTGKLGTLASDSALKMIVRQLQSSIVRIPTSSSKYNTLADIGITTNPKSGELNFSEAKVKEALADDYDSVARLFIRTSNSEGVAQVMAEKLKSFRDPVSGVLKTKTRGFERIIENQDKEIERKERLLAQKEQSIRRQFTSLEGNLSSMQAQGDFLKSRLGGAQGGAN